MRQLFWSACLLCALAATPVLAQSIRVDVNAPPAPSITVQPHWQWDPDDQVYVTSDPNLDYDMFRSGQWYYVYNDGYWYRASNWSGPYSVINQDQVPRSFFYLSENRYTWRSRRPTLSSNDAYGRYDSNSRYGRSSDRDYDDRRETSGPVIQSPPRWRWVPEQHVYVAVNPDRNYDMFRSGDWYYVYQDGSWYRGTRWSGPFTFARDNSVPYEVIQVSRSYGSYDRNERYGQTDSYVQVPVIRRRPHWHWMADQRVFVNTDNDRDYDMYRVGSWYYVTSNGAWFRARRWDGPYEMIQTRMVPQPVFSVTSNPWDRSNRRHHHDRDRD